MTDTKHTGVKGPGQLEAGYVYAPYVPLIVTPMFSVRNFIVMLLPTNPKETSPTYALWHDVQDGTVFSSMRVKR